MSASGKTNQEREERRARLAALPALTREEAIEALRRIIAEIEDSPLPVHEVYFDHYQAAQAALKLLTTPPAELLESTLGVTSVADFSAIIVRQEREKQALHDQIAMLRRRAERAEAERDALGLALSSFGTILQQKVYNFDHGRPHDFAALPDVLNAHVAELYNLATDMRAAPKAARDVAYRKVPVPAETPAEQAERDERVAGILQTALTVGADKLRTELDWFSGARAAILEAPEVIDAFVGRLTALQRGMLRAATKAERIDRGQEVDA